MEFTLEQEQNFIIETSARIYSAMHSNPENYADESVAIDRAKKLYDQLISEDLIIPPRASKRD
ncbi:hypothetical protein AAEU29_10985 [Pseudoalteromonas sp. SSM20]|uniref:hypothetical protein n=1 Tax=Pseudoalteromonas sp. SSM20 TaxID=3139394 RepID=UPI003BAAD146